MVPESKGLAFRTLMGCFLVALLLAEITAKRPLRALAIGGSPQPPLVDRRAACALSLTRSLLADSSHITVLGHAPWLSGFLQATAVPVTLLEVKSKRQVIRNLQSDVTFLVTDGAGNSSFVDTALKTLQALKAPNMRIVVWWRSGDADYAMDAAQYLHTSRLIIVSGSNSTLQIFKMREYCVNLDHVARAALAGDCDQMELLKANGDLFVDLLHLDYEGCPLNLTTWRDPPYRILKKRSDGMYDLTGTHALIAYTFAKSLNATLAVGYWSYYKTEILFSLYTSGTTITGPAFYEGCDAFIVPSGLGEKADLFRILHREYPPIVWTLAAVTYVVVILLLAVSWCGIREQPLQDAAFFSLAVLLRNNVSTRLTANADRILIASWLLFSLVLSISYPPLLHRLQVVPPKTPEMNSLAQLEQSGLPIVGSESSTEVWIAAAQLEKDNTTLQTLGERSSPEGAVKASLKTVAWNRTAAVLCPWELYLNNIRDLDQAAGRKLLHKIPGFCTRFNRMQYLRPFKTGSRLHPILTKLMTRWLDVGLLHLVHKELKYNWSEENWGLIPLGWRSMSVAFVVLGIGFVVSALVLVMEYLVVLVKLAREGAIISVLSKRSRKYAVSE